MTLFYHLQACSAKRKRCFASRTCCLLHSSSDRNGPKARRFQFRNHFPTYVKSTNNYRQCYGSICHMMHGTESSCSHAHMGLEVNPSSMRGTTILFGLKQSTGECSDPQTMKDLWVCWLRAESPFLHRGCVRNRETQQCISASTSAEILFHEHVYLNTRNIPLNQDITSFFDPFNLFPGLFSVHGTTSVLSRGRGCSCSSYHWEIRRNTVTKKQSLLL